MASLRTAFDAYTQLVASKTERLRAGPRSHGVLTDVSKPEWELRDIVESLEKGAEFKELVRVTRSTPTFQEKWHSDSDNFWAERVRRFFRRSRAYSQYLSEPQINGARQFAKFKDAFKQRKMLVRFLAPLEFVSFSRDLNCDSFSIRRFSRAELDEILQTKVNEIFYPHAVADTAKLCKYWFLVAEEYQSVGPAFVYHGDELGTVPASYQLPPGPIEKALKVLSLFDWEHATAWSGRREGWGRFRLPFVILTDDALLRAPCGAPDCSRLAVRWKSGEPAISGRLGKDASSQLENFSREIGSLLAQYRAALSVMPQKRRRRRKGQHPDWYFLEIALTCFVCAFQTKGLDQLLWYWVAIEALVGGESGEPVCSTIRDRLKKMLGSTESDQEKIKKQVKYLYGLRCDLVHGNVLLDLLPATDLYDLRELARQAILWFAHCLDHVRRVYPSDDPSLLPRAQLLSALDFDEIDRYGSLAPAAARMLDFDLQEIENLLHAMPRGFPNVTEWTKSRCVVSAPFRTLP